MASSSVDVKRVPIVDTHFHVWDFQRFNYLWPRPLEERKIYKTILPQDYKNEMDNTNIHASIFVEVYESLEETKWILQLAEEFSFIKGVVGFVDLASDDVEAQIKVFKQNPKFVGVRKVLMGDDDWLERDDVLRGMEALQKNNLTYDLLIKSRSEYESAKRFLDRAPSNLKIVLNHLGKPDAKSGADQAWFDDISTIASHQNVYCKLSGMVTEADWENWKPSDFKAHVDHVIEKFGIDRVMFGSDWPVCKLANADLPDVYDLLLGLLSNLSDIERSKVFGLNAVKFYNLQLDR